MPKTAKQQLDADKVAKVVVLEKSFAGVKQGSYLFIATPKIVDAYIRAIPFGETRTIVQMRAELAEQNKADASCPTSTSIFIRIAAQAAIDELNEGATTDTITPFWRILCSTDKPTQKLTIDAEWLDHQRKFEQM